MRSLAASAGEWLVSKCSACSIKIGEKLLLPIVEHARPDRRQIGQRQHVQHLEHFRRADLNGELHHDAVVADVLLLRQVAHSQVLQDEKPHRFGLVLRQTQPRGGLLRQAGPDLAMIAA